MAFHHVETGQDFMTIHQDIQKPQGIWDVEGKKLPVEISTPQQIAQLERWQYATNAAIVYLDSPNFHHPDSTIIGVAGFIGMATSMTVKHLFDEDILEYIDEQLATKGQEPLFLVAKVDCKMSGSEEKVEFIKASNPIDK